MSETQTSNKPWEMVDALALVRANQNACMRAGYYLALAGGVLNTGYSLSDLDLVAVPRSDSSSLPKFMKCLERIFGAQTAPPQPVCSAQVLTFRYQDKSVEIVLVNHQEKG
jgi:hypothetical protein